MARAGWTRRTIDFSECDLRNIHAIMTQHSRSTEADAVRWALHTLAKATEIVVKLSSGEVLRYTREG